jgi:hypothetical protein
VAGGFACRAVLSQISNSSDLYFCHTLPTRVK